MVENSIKNKEHHHPAALSSSREFKIGKYLIYEYHKQPHTIFEYNEYVILSCPELTQPQSY